VKGSRSAPIGTRPRADFHGNISAVLPIFVGVRVGRRSTRTLFVGLAMIETMAIYALVVALLVLFANPFVK
jgi:hypothetical protein